MSESQNLTKLEATEYVGEDLHKYVALRLVLITRRNELDFQIAGVDDVIRTMSRLRPDLAATVPQSQRSRRTKTDIGGPLRKVLQDRAGQWFTTAEIDELYRKTIPKDAIQPSTAAVRNAIAYMYRTTNTITRKQDPGESIKYSFSMQAGITGDNVKYRK
jgi:hypothetical protein